MKIKNKLLFNKKIIFLSWLLLVILWNFTFPTVPPLYDVGVAVLLSFYHSLLIKKYHVG